MTSALDKIRLAALLAACALPSCGGAVGEALRPDDHTAAGAVGGKAPTCAGEPRYAKPLIVDLDPDARVDLEATMKKGVAVVAYDCSSFRVLGSCKLSDSSYDYAGVSRKEQVIQMKSADDLHANLPLSSAKLGGEVQSGRSIDLALVLVGRRSTTLAKVGRDALTGACDGATHYVQSAAVGAFSMATGSLGKAAVVAEMFNYGGGASSQSERKAMNMDGSLDACRKSEPDSETPPAECRAPLRVELSPIASTVVATGKVSKEEKKEALALESPCPPGFQFADGICTRDAGKAHLCAANDEADCKAQCDKGSPESCFNYGRLVARKTSREAALPFHKKACDGEFGDACAEVGYAMLPDTDGGGVEAASRAALAVLNKACNMGSGLGCDRAGDTLSDKDYKVLDMAAAARAYDRGCSLGRGMACWSLSQMYFKGNGLPQDSKKGVALLAKACQGGSADECNDLALLWTRGQHGVTVDLEGAYRANRKACELDKDYCGQAAESALKAGKQTEAFGHAKVSCNQAEDEDACVLLADLYTRGVGTSPDPVQAKAALEKACKNGDGDDKACKKLGIPMKP
jgi:TPR repeat protein